MNIGVVFLLVVILFTNQGPTLRVAPVEDQATCERMAAGASDALTGQKVPVTNTDGEQTDALVLDAEGFCNVAHKSEHADNTKGI